MDWVLPAGGVCAAAVVYVLGWVVSDNLAHPSHFRKEMRWQDEQIGRSGDSAESEPAGGTRVVDSTIVQGGLTPPEPATCSS